MSAALPKAVAATERLTVKERKRRDRARLSSQCKGLFGVREAAGLPAVPLKTKLKLR